MVSLPDSSFCQPQQGIYTMDQTDNGENFSAPKIKSHSFGASLYREVTAMDTMMVYQSFKEQRKYPRFTPEHKLFILHSTLGTVKNISIGGLAYTYYQFPKQALPPAPKNGTIFSAGNDHLLDIPFTVVSEKVIRKSYSHFPEMKQRRIRFTSLSGKQLQGLEHFILKHAVIQPEATS